MEKRSASGEMAAYTKVDSWMRWTPLPRKSSIVIGISVPTILAGVLLPLLWSWISHSFRPTETPECDGKPMQPDDICELRRAGGSGILAGTKTYADMLGQRDWGSVIIGSILALIVLGVALAVIGFFVLSLFMSRKPTLEEATAFVDHYTAEHRAMTEIAAQTGSPEDHEQVRLLEKVFKKRAKLTGIRIVDGHVMVDS